MHSSLRRGKFVPRLRTIAIAALAVSALLVTSGAAYAHELAQRKTAQSVAPAPSMSWAHYRGGLTDLSPGTRDVYDGATASAYMMGINGQSTFRVTIRGLDKKAIHNKYGAHLHTGPCGLDEKGEPTVGGHYNTTTAGQPLVVNDKTEVWLNLHVNSERTASATAAVTFVPDGERSITFHEKATIHHGDGVGTAGLKLACIPLNIKKFAGASQ
jgi:hypothetical protein